MEHRITHACGHAQSHFIPGFPAQQERKARWLRTTTCRDCFLATRRAAEAETASDDGHAIARLSLVALAGSTRQVAWATAIRARRLATLVREGRIDDRHDHPCLAIGDARWWIDHRDEGDGELLRRAMAMRGGQTVSRAA